MKPAAGLEVSPVSDHSSCTTTCSFAAQKTLTDHRPHPWALKPAAALLRKIQSQLMLAPSDREANKERNNDSNKGKSSALFTHRASSLG